jgi:hypothetical protein
VVGGGGKRGGLVRVDLMTLRQQIFFFCKIKINESRFFLGPHLYGKHT